MKLRLKMGQIWYVWGAFCLAKEGLLSRNLELFLNVFLFLLRNFDKKFARNYKRSNF